MLHGFVLYKSLYHFTRWYVDLFSLKIRWFLPNVPIHLKLLKLNQSIQTWNWSVVWLFGVMYTCTLTVHERWYLSTVKGKSPLFHPTWKGHLFPKPQWKKHSLSSRSSVFPFVSLPFDSPWKMSHESLRGIHQTSHKRHKISYLTWKYGTWYLICSSLLGRGVERNFLW